MSKRAFPALLIIIVVFYIPIHMVFVETVANVLTQRASELLEYAFGPERARTIATAIVPYFAPGVFSALAIYAAYSIGVWDRKSFAPTPDLDPRKAFAEILADKKWVKQHTENDPEKRARLVSNYIGLRLDGAIHAAIAQGRIWVWGSKSLPKADGPFQRIPAEKWDEMAIDFVPAREATPAYSKWREKDGIAYVDLKFSSAQVAKEFSMNRRGFR